MDIKAILAAAASVAKPEPYVIGGHTLYVRRFTCEQQADFIAACKAKNEKNETITKFWVIAFGLCDEKNQPLFETPDDGESQLKGLLIEDQEALEALVYRKLGIELEKSKKS